MSLDQQTKRLLFARVICDSRARAPSNICRNSAAVFRAFGAQDRALALADSRVDDANRALFYLWQTNQWLRVSMNLVGQRATPASRHAAHSPLRLRRCRSLCLLCLYSSLCLLPC